MTQLERNKVGHRLVEWSGSAISNEVDIQPGSVATLALPTAFAGSKVTILVPGIIENEGTESETITTGSAWIDLKENDSIVEIPVGAGASNIMPVELFCANGTVKFKSDASETCRGQYRPVA